MTDLTRELNKLSGSNGCLAGMIVLVLIVAYLGINALIIMWLWNWVMVAVFGLKLITAWEALGLFVLSNMFFKSWITSNTKK